MLPRQQVRGLHPGADGESAPAARKETVGEAARVVYKLSQMFTNESEMSFQIFSSFKFFVNRCSPTSTSMASCFTPSSKFCTYSRQMLLRLCLSRPSRLAPPSRVTDVWVEPVPVQWQESMSPLSAQILLRFSTNGYLLLGSSNCSSSPSPTMREGFCRAQARMFSRVKMANLAWDKFVLSRQSRQFIRTTPNWIRQVVCSSTASVQKPNCLRTSLILRTSLLTSWQFFPLQTECRSKNQQRMMRGLETAISSSNCSVSSCSQGFYLQSRFTHITRLYFFYSCQKCFLKASLLQLQRLVIATQIWMLPVCLQKSGTLPLIWLWEQIFPLKSRICQVSIKLATFPSQSIPRALKRVPPIFQDLLDIRKYYIFFPRTKLLKWSTQPWIKGVNHSQQGQTSRSFEMKEFQQKVRSVLALSAQACLDRLRSIRQEQQKPQLKSFLMFTRRAEIDYQFLSAQRLFQSQRAIKLTVRSQKMSFPSIEHTGITS